MAWLLKTTPTLPLVTAGQVRTGAPGAAAATAAGTAGAAWAGAPAPGSEVTLRDGKRIDCAWE